MSKKNELRTEFQRARIASPESPFYFADGRKSEELYLSYETYGELNEDKSNAILLFHALTGSQHAAGYNPDGPEGYEKKFWTKDNHHGWWDHFIGPKKALDTRHFFVICINYLGGCYGSSGPVSINPETGDHYGKTFPYPTISDVVDSQVILLEKLGIEKLVAVIGGSLGGCMAIDLAVRYAPMVHAVIPIATGLRATVLAKAMNFEQIYAIEEDKNFNNGDYYEGDAPISGLCLARLISHKTFVSLNVIEQRAKGTILQPYDFLSGYKLQNNVESYMLHQGRKFTTRFDANSYLRIMHMWQTFDLPHQIAGGDVEKTFEHCEGQDWLIFSISSDVCFYTTEQMEIYQALKANKVDSLRMTVDSEKGHDSFLIEPELYLPQIRHHIGEAYERIIGEDLD